MSSQFVGVQYSNLSPRSSIIHLKTLYPQNNGKGKVYQIIWGSCDRCMYYGRPSEQCVSRSTKKQLCLQQQRTLCTATLYNNYCTLREAWHIYIRAAPTSQHRERPSSSSLRYITGPQPTRPPQMDSKLIRTQD